ncbi:MAG: type II toxin-antitoxin system RelE/ParE family toxin [Phenylobacterium sp.]|uniref:type II toxin-antitoxin system RelE/ParE family toxin n=1 Tax=Phenylobacterium sp. TaxID=1871053 RepID=UPI0039198A7E
MSAIGSLSDMPGRGRPGRLTGTRELVVTATGHIVVYALRRDEVAVLRIRHGKQRWPD